MPTVIDSLIVKLGLDSSEYEAKKGKVDKGLKDTGKAADGAQKSINDTAKAAVKFLAILGGTAAIKHFVADMIETNAALDRLSQNLKENVSTISAWSNAAEVAGGSAEGLQGTMDMLSRSQTELQLTGQSGLIPYFTALGIRLADTHGRARPVSDLMLDMADRFGKMDRTTANNMGRMMGVDQGTMQLLLQGRGEVELMIARQKEYNVVTKQQAEESSRLRRAIVESKQSFAAFGRELVSAATPALEKVFSVMAAFGDWARQNKEFIQTFLKIVAAGLGALAVAMIPINLTVVAVLALAAAIAALWQDFQVWKRGGDSLLPWETWAPAIEKAIEGIKKLRNFLMDAGFRMAAFLTMTYKFAKGDRKGAKQAADALVKGMAQSLAEDAEANGGGGRGATRGIRNNNPGNLNYAGQAGATKEGGANGRFAVFGSMREGVGALVSQIGRYIGRGKNTIRQIIETYAPASENNTAAYIAAVSKKTGIAPDAPLSAGNAMQIKSLVRAIVDHESGPGAVSDGDLVMGYRMAMHGIPGASGAAAGAGAATTADARAPGAGRGGSVETNIGEINIHTQATDASGIAKDMGRSLEYLFASQANVGVN